MDWWGIDGYRAGISRYQNVNIVDQITTLHIPVDCIEMEYFRLTVKQLYRFCDHILKQSLIIGRAIFQEKQKYEAVDISTPSSSSSFSTIRRG